MYNEINREAPGPRFTLIIASGCGVLVLITILSLLGLILLRIAVGENMVDWWRNWFGDPIFHLIVRMVFLAKGSPIWALTLCAFGVWCFERALQIITVNLLKATVFSSQVITPQAAEMEKIYGELRKIYSDDLERIALYERQLLGNKGKLTLAKAGVKAGAGCLLSIFWQIMSAPIRLMMMLAVYDGLMRLFAGIKVSRSIEASAGDLFPRLNAYLPLERIIGGIELTERSWELSLLAAVLGVLIWFLKNSPIAIFTWPRGIPAISWVILCLGTVLMFLLMNGLLLYLVCVVMGLILLEMSVSRFAIKPLYLRGIGAFHRFRNRYEKS